MSPLPGTIHGITTGGLAGTHADPGAPAVLVAPATADEKNTIRPPLIPLACWKIEDLRFEFGSSVILPESKEDLPLLAALIDEHAEPRREPGQPRSPQAKLPRATVFGHADPVGDDDFNKRLSGRRAAAVYGMLTRRDEVWEDLFSNTRKFASPAAGDEWGIRSLQIMLNELLEDEPDKPEPGAASGADAATGGGGTDADGVPNGLDPTEDLGAGPDDPPEAQDTRKLLDEPLVVNNILDPPTRDAIRRFQQSGRGRAAGLPVDGQPSQPTRRAIFLAYMDVICVDEDGEPFTVDREKGFLGRGQDAAGKTDFQGCSEFNPLMVFSRKEKAEFDAATDKSKRNAENEMNRRVLVLLFRPAVSVSGFWPCPRALEGVAGCRKRFWSDGERRRSPADTRREFADTRDTFACRFYQRLTTNSPCERALPGPRVPFRVKVHDIFHKPCRNEIVTLTGAGGFFERARTDDEGVLTFKAPAGLATVVVHYTPKDRKLNFTVTATLLAPDRKDDAASLAHVDNFGFGSPDATGPPALVKFQAARRQLKLTAELDPPTKQAVDELVPGSLEDGVGSQRG